MISIAATNRLKSLLAVSFLFSASACTQSLELLKHDSGLFQAAFGSSDSERYLDSGTIILSRQVPDKSQTLTKLTSADNTLPSQTFAPLVGYFPPAMTYLPADNETWLEIDREKSKILLYKGKAVIKEMPTEGVVSIAPGDYFLQHKQKQPLWYAPNEYFAKRQLNVPGPNDHLRYRRGALGGLALFPTTTFPIHSAPIWSSEVGGLRVSESDLSAIYYLIHVGSPVVVK